MKENTTNRITGTRFETELCELMAKKGWWVHNMAQNQSGQPADVIAVKNNYAVLIDCKYCANDTFPLTRVEPNQETAMTLWEQCGNSSSYFALKLSDGSIHMVSFYEVSLEMGAGCKAFDKYSIENCMSFEDWLDRMEYII